MTYSQKFFNSANESNPEGELAVNILVGNIIEIATAHANMPVSYTHLRAHET